MTKSVKHPHADPTQDKKDLAVIRENFGPSIEKCKGGRYIAEGFCCPHCNSDEPQIYCEGWLKGHEPTYDVEITVVERVTKDCLFKCTFEQINKLRTLYFESSCNNILEDKELKNCLHEIVAESKEVEILELYCGALG